MIKSIIRIALSLTKAEREGILPSTLNFTFNNVLLGFKGYAKKHFEEKLLFTAVSQDKYTCGFENRLLPLQRKRRLLVVV
jgi:hypothetical protein